VNPGDMVRLRESMLVPHWYESYRGQTFICLDVHESIFGDDNDDYLNFLCPDGVIRGFYAEHMEVVR
jgi:hypothetical protein